LLLLLLLLLLPPPPLPLMMLLDFEGAKHNGRGGGWSAVSAMALPRNKRRFICD